MKDDLIKRSDAIAEIRKARTPDVASHQYAELFINAVCRAPSADRPSEVIYGNEHNCIMTIFGECSYAETGCGDCAVVEKVRKALSADRPQGEWICHEGGWIDLDYYPTKYECDQCHHYVNVASDKNFCPNCGADMRKGADDETDRR